jgi:hypothetical protein
VVYSYFKNYKTLLKILKGKKKISRNLEITKNGKTVNKTEANAILILQTCKLAP